MHLRRLGRHPLPGHRRSKLGIPQPGCREPGCSGRCRRKRRMAASASQSRSAPAAPHRAVPARASAVTADWPAASCRCRSAATQARRRLLRPTPVQHRPRRRHPERRCRRPAAPRATPVRGPGSSSHRPRSAHRTRLAGPKAATVRDPASWSPHRRRRTADPRRRWMGWPRARPGDRRSPGRRSGRTGQGRPRSARRHHPASPIAAPARDPASGSLRRRWTDRSQDRPERRCSPCHRPGCPSPGCPSPGCPRPGYPRPGVRSRRPARRRAASVRDPGPANCRRLARRSGTRRRQRRPERRIRRPAWLKVCPAEPVPASEPWRPGYLDCRLGRAAGSGWRSKKCSQTSRVSSSDAAAFP